MACRLVSTSMGITSGFICFMVGAINGVDGGRLGILFMVILWMAYGMGLTRLKV